MRRFVGQTAETLPSNRSRPIIQNLGPGVIYIDSDEDVTTETGFEIPVGAAYEAPLSGTQIWMISTHNNTDVRIFGSTDSVSEEAEPEGPL